MYKEFKDLKPGDKMYLKSGKDIIEVEAYMVSDVSKFMTIGIVSKSGTTVITVGPFDTSYNDYYTSVEEIRGASTPRTFGDVKVGDKIYCFINTEFDTREVKYIANCFPWIHIFFGKGDFIEPRKTDTCDDGYYVCLEELVDDVKHDLGIATSFLEKERAHA